MRVLIVLFTVVLFLIAVAGLGWGALIAVRIAERADRADGIEIFAGFAVALAPILIGTTALGFVTVIMGIDQSRSEQLTAMDELIRLNHNRNTNDDAAPASESVS